MAQRVHIEPDVSVPELISRLTDDSKRLVNDEIRLAKVEISENLKVGTRGVLWLVVAFGFGVVAIAALTITLTALIGWAVNGNYWLGAIVTALLELGVGVWLIMRGVKSFAEPSYTLGQTRQEASRTAQWIRSEHES